MGDQPALRLEWRDPMDLTPHPKNFRQHPEEQREALQGVMERVGWAGAILLNEQTGRILNGHLRREISGQEEKVPVLIGSWDEADEDLILATFDAIGEEARPDPEALTNLLNGIGNVSAGVKGLFDRMRKKIAPKEKGAGKRSIPITADQWTTISEAIERVRESEGDPEIPEGRCIELICADFLAQ